MNRPTRPIIFLLILTLTFLLSILLFKEQLYSAQKITAAGTLSLATLGLFLVSRAFPNRPLSLGFSYLLLFALFHLSLLPYVLQDSRPQVLDAVHFSWISSGYLAPAIYYVS